MVAKLLQTAVRLSSAAGALVAVGQDDQQRRGPPVRSAWFICPPRGPEGDAELSPDGSSASMRTTLACGVTSPTLPQTTEVFGPWLRG